jgi:hypothetical protein
MERSGNNTNNLSSARVTKFSTKQGVMLILFKPSEPVSGEPPETFEPAEEENVTSTAHSEQQVTGGNTTAIH